VGRDETGIVVDIDLGAASPTFIALRSELDCVQVNDDKQVPYASTRPGLCHACGHDAHSTILLGLAIVVGEQLDALRRLPFRHNVRLVFQPAEETASGARSMIQQGALDGVEAIVAVHVDPFLEVGRLGMRHGPMTAACKSFRVHLRGRGGHSARPHEAIDPIPAALNLVNQFYMLGPRSIDTRYPLALTVASISAGSSFNAIPDEAEVRGTLRTTRLQDTEGVQKQMEAAARGIATSTGCDVHLEFLEYSPPTNNDPAIVEQLSRCAERALGRDSVTWVEVASVGAEDFAYYQELIAGALIRLGAAVDDGRARRPLHSTLFDINEGAIRTGTRFMTRAALDLALSLDGRQV
jgi:amidohydrolase